MRTLQVLTLLLTIWSHSYGQDGSDIRYFKVSAVDTTLIGQYVQFDFFRRSFGAQSIDNVIINIDNRPIKFVERRNDNGYNNWFFEQYLQSVDTTNGQTIRISKFRLDYISLKSFQVTMYVDFYDTDHNFIADKSRQVRYWFDKKDVAEVLVKSKQL